MNKPFLLSLEIIGLLCTLTSQLYAEIIVTTATDEDNGSISPEIGQGTSLREAVDHAPDNLITFAPNLDGQTITLRTGQLLIDKDLTIDASNLTGGLTIDANQQSRIIEVCPDNTVALHGLTLTGGDSTNEPFHTNGGAICNRNGTLSLHVCNLFGNSASRGGAISNDGFGSNFSAALSLSDCTLSENFSRFGGAINNEAAYSSSATLSLNACTLSANSALEGGAIYSLVGSFFRDISGSVTVSLTACTISGNSTGIRGGGIYSSPGGGDSAFSSAALTLIDSTLSANGANGNGGGIYCGRRGALSLTNCTLSGNSSTGQGGGIYNVGGQGQAGGAPASLTTCTISDNFAGIGGGGFFNASFGSLSLSDTILAGNISPGSADFGGNTAAIIENGNSLFDANTPVDPMLAPLGDYGGPTQTMPPLPGSSAIDAGSTTDPGGTDQRAEPRFAGGALDIGAVEIQSTIDTCNILAAAWETDSDSDGSSFGVEFALGTNPAVSDPENLQNLQFGFANNDHPTLEFGYNFEAVGKAISIIERSTDLENWVEIFRSANPDDGPDFIANGVDTFINAGTSTVIFDNNISPTTIGDFNSALTPKIFYRFRAAIPAP